MIVCFVNLLLLFFRSSLPELLEKKRLIDMHTNIATALLGHIKERKLDIYFETEEKLMSRSMLDKSIMDIITNPEGTVRLLLAAGGWLLLLLLYVCCL